MPRDPAKQKILHALSEKFSGPGDTGSSSKTGTKTFFMSTWLAKSFGAGWHAKKRKWSGNALLDKLQEAEWGRISLVEPLSPAEARKYWPPMPELNGR